MDWLGLWLCAPLVSHLSLVIENLGGDGTSVPLYDSCLYGYVGWPSVVVGLRFVLRLYHHVGMYCELVC